MQAKRPLKVAVLVDLLRTAEAGGHIRCWERMAEAAANSSLPLDLTVYFAGPGHTETLSPHVRFRHMPPMFSTSNLKFLPYVPDHTDLAPYHPRLARELPQYDLIHSTDGFFAFAQTAARVARKHNIPLVTSFHTDTPSYTRIFTRNTLEKLFGRFPALRNKLVNDWQIPERKERSMIEKLTRHVQAAQYALVTRQEDHDFAAKIIGDRHVHHLRLGINKALFRPEQANRVAMLAKYNIPADRVVLLFVGRVDIGKNIYTLANAMAKLIKEGVPLHLIAAGKGPASDDVKQILGDNVSLPGYVAANDLAPLYASADGLALSSEVEIRSMTGVEAMASSCPVLVSAKSGVAELFHHTPAMQVVEGGVDNWAEAIRAFATNPAKRLQMKHAAFEYSQKTLGSWEDILTQDVFAIWQKAIAEKHFAVSQAIPYGAPEPICAE